jgi:hypothetical protein
MHVLLVMRVYQHGNTREVTLLLITVDNACIVGHVCVCASCVMIYYVAITAFHLFRFSCHNGSDFTFFKALLLS